MKQYMLLLIGRSDNKLDHLPEEKINEIYQKFGEWVKDLQVKNRFIGGDALQENRKRLSMQNNKLTVDGPFTEAKEVVNGYFIIKAESMDEALELTRSHPAFLYDGKIEVIEMMQLK
jgi:hypothetical protein